MSIINQQYVDDALACALSQGYTFEGWSAADIALDMLAFDAEVAGVPLETLEPLVADWQARHREPCERCGLLYGHRYPCTDGGAS